MFRKASSTVPISLKQQISDLSLEELGNSVDQLLKGELINTPANKFLQKIKTVCGSMGHTGAASKRARMKSFAMMLKFGLPSVMFTINPRDDNMVFLKVATADGKDDQTFNVPHPKKNEKELQDFLSEMSDLRHKIPWFVSTAL